MLRMYELKNFITSFFNSPPLKKQFLAQIEHRKTIEFITNYDKLYTWTFEPIPRLIFGLFKVVLKSIYSGTTTTYYFYQVRNSHLKLYVRLIPQLQPPKSELT